MIKSVMYTKDNCKYCAQAKILLNMRNIAFDERKITNDEEKKELIALVPSAKTLPQIFISGVYVGGFDDLKALSDADRMFVNKAGNVIIQ